MEYSAQPKSQLRVGRKLKLDSFQLSLEPPCEPPSSCYTQPGCTADVYDQASNMGLAQGCLPAKAASQQIKSFFSVTAIPGHPLVTTNMFPTNLQSSNMFHCYTGYTQRRNLYATCAKFRLRRKSCAEGVGASEVFLGLVLQTGTSSDMM